MDGWSFDNTYAERCLYAHDVSILCLESDISLE